MNDIRLYKFKSKYLNYFFWQNNILFVKVKDNNNQITYTEVIQNDITYIVIIIDKKIKSIKKDKRFRELVFGIVDNMKKPDCLYTDIRLVFNSQSIITLSKKMSIDI